MASQHVEVEAAKLLHKLIQESKDEPAKLAMKLHVICQHMRSSGKETSLPYQVISRAMETVVSQNRLDMDALRSSRLPFSGGSQMGDSGHARPKDNENLDNQIPTGAIGVPHAGLPGGNWHAASSSQTKEAPFAGSHPRAMESVVSQNRLDMDALQSTRLPVPGGPQMGDSGHVRSNDKETPDNQLPIGAISMHQSGLPGGSWQPASGVQTKASPFAGSFQNYVPGGPQMGDFGHIRPKDKDPPDSQLPTSAIGVPHAGPPGGNWQAASSSQPKEAPFAGSFQNYGMPNDSKATSDSIHMALPGRPHMVVTRVESIGADARQGSLSQRSSKSSDHGSPASVPMEDTRSPNSHERNDSTRTNSQKNKKDAKKTGSKRKKADPKAGRAMQENAQVPSDRTVDKTKNTSSLFATPIPRLPEEGEVSSSSSAFGLQKGGLPPSRSSSARFTSIWNQNRVNLPSENSQGSVPGLVESSSVNKNEAMYPANEPKNNMQEVTNDRPSLPLVLPTVQSHGIGKVSVGKSGAFSSFSMAKMGVSAPTHYNSSSLGNHDLFSKETSSGSQFLEKGKDVICNNPSVDLPSFASDQAAEDSENRNFGIMREGAPRFPERSLETQEGSSPNRSDSSTAFVSSGKAIMQERGTLRMKGNSYNIPQGSGIHERQNNVNVSGKDETVYQMNQEFFIKPKMDASSFGEAKKNLDSSTLINIAPMNIGSSFMSQASAPIDTPFKEHQLKQLRAQCLVFLAFRSNILPRKLHLDIALGGSYPKEEGTTNRGDTCSKEPATNHESSSIFGRQNEVSNITPAPGSSSTGSVAEMDLSKDTENTKKSKKLPILHTSMIAEETKRASAFRQKTVPEMQTQGTVDSHTKKIMPKESSSIGHEGTKQTNHQSTWTNQFSVLGHKIDGTMPRAARVHDHPSRESPETSMLYREQALERVGTYSSKSQIKPDSPMSEAVTPGDNYRSSPSGKDQNVQTVDVVNSKFLTNSSKFFTHAGLTGKLSATPDKVFSNGLADAYSGSIGSNGHRISVSKIEEKQKLCDTSGLKSVSADSALKHENPGTIQEKTIEQEEENNSASEDVPASPPKYTTSEKWIMDQQKRKLDEEKKWVLKQKKAEGTIKACFDKLKENVSSSEDLSTKTKNVIQLKKLQLLQLQRRLRSDFLNDYFKPITSDMDRLKAIKKNRHGRRAKQLEKIEQKMKEERQKRIRERQKEFFGEIETHRERLEDSFKVKRERWKGFNKYVKEFHKRKERIHREKIDKIQREKINLLKNNDVEGYLRMVQDAKSDRVKQLLKETENYLQKLSSKLQDAKSISRRFDMDESRAVNVVDMNDVVNDNGDETDQAQHYLVSNEKYYMMAHSVKESINEQPKSLQGGKLREYQMNGLRWLVSLYNNHLNGILADEMGLGKTVQVIALICYLLEAKNDRGPFLVVVPSSVLPGWESEISFWAPGINKIVYAGLPEERRRLFKERIVHQKFNVLLTTYEYLMNKHDRPKLSKIHWHYVIIDEGHRIKNASCKLNADLKQYQSSHRLLLTGTPLQNNLEELWALLNFLLPDIFNSSEDFSQWFNKPFESNGDNSADEALLSEEENLLIINRLHQVLRPFVLRRLKHKVENELPEKIERLVRCEASSYQKLLMKRVEENLGTMGNAKVRSVHNTVMELRNICNHPYLSQLHAEEIDSLIPKHYLPPVVRLCGKLEMLDRLLPKLKATDHRVLFFSTMTRLLDVMEEYLSWKRYRYLRLDGHTAGSERGALIGEFNRPGSEAFIFLLSIRAGGVGVNLQAADTVIIFDTDWNPQVDLQAQARAHRIGQKKDVLVLRLETVRTVEEQVRAAAEHKLGVANQSITAGFFDNNTSAEDRREYLESLLREGKKEEVAPVLDDDALNYLLARSESEIDVFEAVDKRRREEETAAWQRLVQGASMDGSEPQPVPLPSRLLTEEDLESFYKAMKISDTPNAEVGAKRKGEIIGGLDTQQYGRGKRAREVRSYEDQWTEEEFERLCQVDSSELPGTTDVLIDSGVPKVTEPELQSPKTQPAPTKEPVQSGEESKPPTKRGRGRPKRAAVDTHPPVTVPGSDPVPAKDPSEDTKTLTGVGTTVIPPPGPAVPPHLKGRKRPRPTGETPRSRGRKQKASSSSAHGVPNVGISAGIPNPPMISGANLVLELQKEPDLASVATSSSSQSQEKPKYIFPTMAIPAYAVKPALIGTKPMAGTMCFMPPKVQDGVKASDVLVGPDQTFERSIPSMDSKLSEKLAKKQDDTSHQNTPETDPSCVNSIEKQNLESSMSYQSSEMKKSAENIESSLPPISLRSVELINHQGNNNIDKVSDLVPGSIKSESFLVASSGQLPSYSTVSVARRGSENKASVTRKKAAAREPRTRSSSSTAACERRARLAGLKQAESPSKGKTVKAMPIVKRQIEKSPLPLNETIPIVTKLSQSTKEAGVIVEKTPSTETVVQVSTPLEGKNSSDVPNIRSGDSLEQLKLKDPASEAPPKNLAVESVSMHPSCSASSHRVELNEKAPEGSESMKTTIEHSRDSNEENHVVKDCSIPPDFKALHVDEGKLVKVDDTCEKTMLSVDEGKLVKVDDTCEKTMLSVDEERKATDGTSRGGSGTCISAVPSTSAGMVEDAAIEPGNKRRHKLEKASIEPATTSEEEATVIATIDQDVSYGTAVSETIGGEPIKQVEQCSTSEAVKMESVSGKIGHKENNLNMSGTVCLLPTVPGPSPKVGLPSKASEADNACEASLTTEKAEIVENLEQEPAFVASVETTIQSTVDIDGVKNQDSSCSLTLNLEKADKSLEPLVITPTSESTLSIQSANDGNDLAPHSA